jgi:hypothetical protein
MAFLVYAVVASALLWLWSRYVQRLSRGAALALLLLPLVFTGRALLTDRVYAPLDLSYNRALSDLHGQIIPWQSAVRAALRRGEWPLWNPSILCGDILAAAAQPAVYDPFQWLGFLLPLTLALTFGATLTFFLAALSTFAFARALGRGEVASLVAAAGYTFCSMLAFFVGWPLGRTWALLPFVLFATRAVIREARVRDALLLTLALALVIVAGHPESLLHVVAIGVVYGAFELARVRSVRALLLACAAGVAALLLTAVYLLPLAEALPQTLEHAIRHDLYAPTPYAVMLKPEIRDVRIARTFLPHWNGVPWRGEAHGFDPLSARAGSLVFGLALAALAVAPRKAETWFFALLALACLSATFGTRPVPHLLHRLPLFSMALNERLAYAAVFALVMLAAIAVDAMRERPRMIALALLLTSFAVGIAHLVTRDAQLAANVSRTLLNESALAELAPPLLVALLLVLRMRHVALAALALLLVQRTSEDGGIYPAQSRAAFYPRTALIASIPRDARVAGTGVSLLPNTAAVYGLEDVRGYEAMTFRRLYDTYPLWSQYQQAWFNRIDDPARPFLSFLNVRTIVDGERLIDNPHALPRAFIPRHIRYERDPAAVVPAMQQNAGFADLAWIEADYPSHETANGTGALTIHRDGSAFAIDADLQSAAWIVVSETAWKGWRAYIDDRRVHTHFANHAFLGVYVPQGHHRLRLVYLPESFTRGRAISLATLALLAAIAIGTRRRRAVASAISAVVSSGGA